MAEESKNAVQNVSYLIKETETNIAQMFGSGSNVDEQIKMRAETQKSLADSFTSIAEAAGSKTQYEHTNEDIHSISSVITDLTRITNLITTSSDALWRVLHD